MTDTPSIDRATQDLRRQIERKYKEIDDLQELIAEFSGTTTDTIDCRACKGTGQVPANSYEPCDTAVIGDYGPTQPDPCVVKGPHEWHHTVSYSYEWHDRDVSIAETVSHTHYKGPEYREQVTTVYRLAHPE